MKENKPNLIETLLEDFINGYAYYNNGAVYIPDEAKEKRHIAYLVAKMRKLCPKLNTEQMRREIKNFFMAGFTVAPDWIRNDPSPAIFNSRFNLLRKLQNSKNPHKVIQEDNIKRNYTSSGNKKIVYTEGKPRTLGEILNNITIDN